MNEAIEDMLIDLREVNHGFDGLVLCEDEIAIVIEVDGHIISCSQLSITNDVIHGIAKCLKTFLGATHEAWFKQLDEIFRTEILRYMYDHTNFQRVGDAIGGDSVLSSQ